MLGRICSVVMAIASVQSAFAANNDDLERFIEQVRNEYQAPGVAVSIVQGDKVIFAKGFGVLSLDGSEKVDKDTIFQLASVTKTFIAAGLGLQVDRAYKVER